MFPVITGEPDALSLTTKLEQNVLEREREREKRERESKRERYAYMVMSKKARTENPTHMQWYPFCPVLI